MRSLSRLEIGILAVVIIVPVAALTALFYEDSIQTPGSDHPPMLDSWGIESGTRFPIIWINVSDAGSDLAGAKLSLVNSTTLAVRFNNTFGIGNAYSGSLSAKVVYTLNCTNVRTGSYYARLVVSDRAGSSSDPAEKLIVLPDNTPPLPEIVGRPWVWFNTTDSLWHFRVNATDGDSDGLNLVVTIYERDSWELVYSHTFPNASNDTSWYAEGAVALQPGKYMIKAGATDKAGWQSLSEIVYFDY